MNNRNIPKEFKSSIELEKEAQLIRQKKKVSIAIIIVVVIAAFVGFGVYQFNEKKKTEEYHQEVRWVLNFSDLAMTDLENFKWPISEVYDLAEQNNVVSVKGSSIKLSKGMQNDIYNYISSLKQENAEVLDEVDTYLKLANEALDRMQVYVEGNGKGEKEYTAAKDCISYVKEYRTTVFSSNYADQSDYLSECNQVKNQWIDKASSLDAMVN